MELGVVILNYRDYETTLQAIHSALRCESIDHIVVVDNCSPNDSVAILKQQQIRDNNQWTFLQASDNKGYAAGNNIGIEYLRDNFRVDVIGIVNPDVLFDDSFIRQIKADFKAYPEYTIITGVQKKPDNRVSDRAFWKRVDMRETLLSNCQKLLRFINRIRGNNFDYIMEQLQMHDTLFPVPVVEGCCLFIRTRDFLQSRIFDENTFLYFEEDILAERVHQMGKKIGVDPSITFIHNHSTSIRKVLSQYRQDIQLLVSRTYYFKQYVNRWGIVGELIYDLTAIMYRTERYLALKYHMLRADRRYE